MNKDSAWAVKRLAPTLVGVASGALVSLDPVVALVEALVAARNGDALVVGEIPAGQGMSAMTRW